MFWIRSGLQQISLSDWLTGPRLVDDTTPEDVDRIRDALRDAVGPEGLRRRQRLELRLRAATDLETLWYLRPDVMDAASHVHGEAEARRRLQRATALFEGLLDMAAPSRH